MINRTHIRQFLAVVDTGNFTRAAARINITQPTLSAGISKLEDDLGTKLFARSNKRVQLTDAGNRFLNHARNIDREFRQAEQDVAELKPAATPIKLGIINSLASDQLSALVKRWHADLPSTPLELLEANERELNTALNQGRVDLAIGIIRAGQSQFNSVALYEEDYVLMLPASHRLASQTHVSPVEVAGETMMARRSCEALSATSRFFTEQGVRPPFSLRSPNDDRVMAMVKAGLGITVAPRSLAQDGITAVILDGFRVKRKIGILFSNNQPLSFTESPSPLDPIRAVLEQETVS